jgi:hypothetical protein
VQRNRATQLALILVATSLALGGLTLGAIKANRWVEFGLFLAAAAALGRSLYRWWTSKASTREGLRAPGTAFAAIGLALAIGVAIVRPRPTPAPAPANVSNTTIYLSRHDRQVIQNYVQKFAKAGDKRTAGLLAGLGVGAATAGTLINAIGTLTSKGKLGLEAAKALLGILDGGISVSVSRTVNVEHPTLSLGGLYIGTRGPGPPPRAGARIVLEHPLFSLGTLRLQARNRFVVNTRVQSAHDPEDMRCSCKELPRTP